MPNRSPSDGTPRAARGRRGFLIDLGRTSAGVVVVGMGLSGCATSGDPTVDVPTAVGSAGAPGTSAPPVAGGARTGLVDLGFVAAYVVGRDGGAVVVDTGVEGSEDAILQVLDSMGMGWDAVSDVILTHSHGDHVGSLAAVADLAPDAGLWAGGDDIPQMSAPRSITPLADGDRVRDLRIIATPGHTPGHISVFDEAGSALFAGDALTGADGVVAGPNPEFTPDMETAVASVRALARLEPEVIHVFHGFPVSSGATELTLLAEQL